MYIFINRILKKSTGQDRSLFRPVIHHGAASLNLHRAEYTISLDKIHKRTMLLFAARGSRTRGKTATWCTLLSYVGGETKDLYLIRFTIMEWEERTAIAKDSFMSWP